MLSKIKAQERLKDGNNSTDYRCWLQYLAEHIDQYGEITAEKASFLDWNKNGQIIEFIHTASKFIRSLNTQIIISTNGIYEFDSEYNVYKINMTLDQYKAYKAPMCYNSYISII